ncbi:hypothetical protein KUTeg_000604 [Tegillarca granosa]|uniref:Coiled-coil domain-containing protein 43 n=1 Tax=Tegillarca granosa TaxID=220873 RepID=A0ABQ9FXZ8_TEGGR|nr:hypothetical protein KUTeg_000604 [Tegillarca granosa]
MATNQLPFEKWLEERLLSVNPDTDTEVFVTYITSILDDTDTVAEDKKESLLDILGQVLEEDGESLCDEIISKWEEENGQISQQNNNAATLATQLSEMLVKQKIEPVKQREKKSSSDADKQAILAQYSNVSDEENDDFPADPGGADKGGGSGNKGASSAVKADPLLVKNTNVEDVQKIEKEKREKAKQEADKKREKDKHDRAAQKQKQQERKDNEKKRTQKGERKR